jgi:hypothetical protein
MLQESNNNSLTEILNNTDNNKSISGGLVMGGGNIKGIKDGYEVYKIKYSGFTTGFTTSKTKLNEWKAARMTRGDSVRSAWSNIKAGKGNLTEYNNYVKKNGH